MSQLSLSNLSSFRTLSLEISPFVKITWQLIYPQYTHVPLFPQYRDISTYFQYRCAAFLIRNVTCLCGFRAATTYLSFRNTTSLRNFTIDVCSFLSNVTSLRTLSIATSPYTHTHTHTHTQNTKKLFFPPHTKLISNSACTEGGIRNCQLVYECTQTVKGIKNKTVITCDCRISIELCNRVQCNFIVTVTYIHTYMCIVEHSGIHMIHI
jgi:hypothetical protein